MVDSVKLQICPGCGILFTYRGLKSHLWQTQDPVCHLYATQLGYTVSLDDNSPLDDNGSSSDDDSSTADDSEEPQPFDGDTFGTSAWKSGLRTKKKPRLDRTWTGKDWNIDGPEKTETAVRSTVQQDLKNRWTNQKPVWTGLNWSLAVKICSLIKLKKILSNNAKIVFLA
jgi:hypothetical protein